MHPRKIRKHIHIVQTQSHKHTLPHYLVNLKKINLGGGGVKLSEVLYFFRFLLRNVLYSKEATKVG